MKELEIHDPFTSHLTDERYEDQPNRPRWWYAAQMRVAGATWPEIAEALGYSDETVALRSVKNARRDRSQDTETLEDIVDLELQRLDMLQLICWRSAQQGDIKSIQTILAIMNLRMKMLGTEKRPDSAEKTTNNTAIFIGGNSEDYIEALRTARNAGKAVGATIEHNVEH